MMMEWLVVQGELRMVEVFKTMSNFSANTSNIHFVYD
jgi:hypothetical protein